MSDEHYREPTTEEMAVEFACDADIRRTLLEHAIPGKEQNVLHDFSRVMRRYFVILPNEWLMTKKEALL